MVGVGGSVAALYASAVSGAVLADVPLILAWLGLLAVGALIAQRRRGNPIGWMLVVAGACGPLSIWAERYAVHAHAVSAEPPATAVWAAWFALWALVDPRVPRVRVPAPTSP